MSSTKKSRLNLYLKKELIEFAKKWSYVTGEPISRMLEEYLGQQKKMVAATTPFQWLNDPQLKRLTTVQNQYLTDIEEYLNNREEEEFCREHPEHPRARMHRQLREEYESSFKEQIQLQKGKERELIQRWLEAFPRGQGENE